MLKNKIIKEDEMWGSDFPIGMWIGPNHGKVVIWRFLAVDCLKECDACVGPHASV